MEQAGRRKLKARMKEHGDTQATLSKEIGLSLSRFNAKLNRTGGAEFSVAEIRAIKQLYGLTSEEVDVIFFS